MNLDRLRSISTQFATAVMYETEKAVDYALSAQGLVRPKTEMRIKFNVTTEFFQILLKNVVNQLFDLSKRVGPSRPHVELRDNEQGQVELIKDCLSHVTGIAPNFDFIN